MIDAKEQLVDQDGSQELSTIVGQPVMPRPIFQFKQCLEPSVEGFDRRASTSVELFATTRLQEYLALLAMG